MADSFPLPSPIKVDLATEELVDKFVHVVHKCLCQEIGMCGDRILLVVREHARL